MARRPPSQEVISEATARAQRMAEGLYPHQVAGLAFLLARRGAILADDMGLGKTRQAVLAAGEVEPQGPYLVVCPASVKANWAREIQMVRPDDEVHVAGGQPQAGWSSWVVINYDILKKNMAWLKGLRFSVVIFDEAHYLKNHRSQRSQYGRDIVEACDDPITYLLTGTPLMNRPREIFPLLNMIKHPMGTSFLSFAKRYCDARKGEYGWVTDGASNLEELSRELKGVLLRRTKDEVLDLPPKIRTYLDVEISEKAVENEQQRFIQALVSGGGERRRGSELIGALSKLRNKLAQAKIKATIDFVSGAVAQGEKVVVFSGFDAPLQKVKEKFGDQCVLLTGKTPAKKRQAMVDQFQNDEHTMVFAANLIAGGVGITLTAARQVVFNDLDWVPANHWQAEDRAYRIGQKGAVHIAYMVAPGTVDSFVQQALKIKAALIETVIDGVELSGESGTDVFEMLRGLMRSLSPGVPQDLGREGRVEWARGMVAEAAAALRRDHQELLDQAGSSATVPELPEDLLDALAKALEGPEEKEIQIPSSSSPGKFYVLRVMGDDVTCSCPGFKYRGMCSHARQYRSGV
jgi:SNF2 family DNA or RNA helicase